MTTTYEAATVSFEPNAEYQMKLPGFAAQICPVCREQVGHRNVASLYPGSGRPVHTYRVPEHTVRPDGRSYEIACPGSGQVARWSEGL